MCQHWKLYQPCFNIGHQRCISVIQRWKSDVGLCLIFNVGSTSFQRWSTTFKKRWSNVEKLAGITMDDNDQKKELPVHIVLGASDYSRSKTMTKTKNWLNWVTSSWTDTTMMHHYLTRLWIGKFIKHAVTRRSTCDNEELCRLDVLGIEDQSSND